MGVKVNQTGDGTDLSKTEDKAAPEAAPAIETAQTELTDPPVTGKTVIPTGPPPGQTEEGLSTVSTFASSVLIGGAERQLTDLTREAKRDSGLTSSAWNDLSSDERSTYIQATVDRMREEEIASTKAAEAATTEPAEDVRVREDRGIGGRYVALGGGERIRVADASTTTDTPIVADEEIKAA